MAANGRVESPQPLCLSDIHQLRAEASPLRRAAPAEPKTLQRADTARLRDARRTAETRRTVRGSAWSPGERLPGFKSGAHALFCGVYPEPRTSSSPKRGES